MQTLVFTALLVGFASCASVFDIRSLEDFQKSFKRTSLMDSLKNQLQNHAIKRLVEEQLKQQKLTAARETRNNIQRDAIEVESAVSHPRPRPRHPCQDLSECPETDENDMLPTPLPNGTYTFTPRHMESFCNYTAELQTCYNSVRYSGCSEMEEVLGHIGAVRGYVCNEGKLPTIALLNCVQTQHVRDSVERLGEAVETLAENGISVIHLMTPDNMCCLKNIAKSLFAPFIRHHCGIQAALAADRLSDTVIDMGMQGPGFGVEC